MFLFPSDDVSKEEKDEKTFGLSVLRAVDWLSRSQSGVFMGTYIHPEMFVRELYSEGNQPVEKYKKLFSGESTNEAAQGRVDRANGSGGIGITSYTNINWGILSPMVKVVSVLRSMMSARDYRVEVKSLTRDHINEKAAKKWRLYTRKMLTNDMRKNMGLPTPESVYEPDDLQGLELADKLGLFKLQLEGTLEKIIEHGFEISEWRTLRRKFQKNTIDHRFRVAKVCCHPIDGAAMFRWVDPKKVVMQWNPDNLGEKPMFVGHYESVQVKELVDTLINEGYSKEVIEDQLKNSLSRTMSVPDFTSMGANQSPVWYNYTIEVLHAEYISTNYDVYYSGKNLDGKDKTVKAKRDKEGNLKANKFENGETIHVNTDFLYEGSFVVGTDFVYQWGPCEHQLRDKKNNIMYSYVWDYLEGRSMTSRAMTILDDLQMCVYKLRAAVAAAAPKGYDIDLGEAANIVVKGKTMDIQDLIRMRRETGISIRKSVKSIGGGKERLSPLEELEGGIGVQMNEWLTMINTNITLLFDELGIPNVLSAQGLQSAEKAVGVVQAEIGGAVNSTFDEIESDLIFKKKLSEAVCMKARVMIKFDNKVRGYYEGLFGKDGVNSIMSIEDLTLEQLGITMVPKPTEAEKAQLMQDCIELTKATRDGFMPFTQADVVMVRSLLSNDQLELATIYMGKTVELNKRKHFAEQQAMVEMNSKSQIASSNAAAENEARLIELKAQAEVSILQAKVQLEGAMKERLQAQKGALEMEQIKVEIEAEKSLGTQIRNPIS